MISRLVQVFVLGALALGFVFLGAGNAQAETGVASWYGPGFAGNPTASGEVYDPSAYTAASKTLPFGTQLEVSYNGNSVDVVVNDRGPYVAGRDLDLSQAAAGAIGLEQSGVGTIEYHAVGDSAVASSGGVSYSGSNVTSSGSNVAASSYSGSSGSSYVVQSGQTLSQIAVQTGVSVEQLAAQNGIPDPDFILSGQVLYY